MEKSTQFPGISGEANADLETEWPASSCACPKTVQWTTSNYRGPVAAWSLSYTANNQPCLCFGCRNMECGSSKIKSDSHRLDREEPPNQQKANSSISKNLKFGIERILTPESCKAEGSSGRYLDFKRFRKSTSCMRVV